MKKNLVIVLIVIFVLLVLGGGLFFIKNKKAKESLLTREPEGVLIETPLKERPYITLTPSSDGHWLTIEVSRIREANILEYELLYNTAGGATQGSIGTVRLKRKASYSKKILLGSESSGHYKFDEGVTQGTLTVRLRGEEGTRKFVTDFHFQQGDEELTSIDNNFFLEGTFPKSIFYLTMSAIGLPGDFSGEVLAGPYEAFSSGSKTVKSGQIKLTLSEELEGAKLYSWSGTEWEEVEAQVEDKTISASISLLTTFIVASPPAVSE